jgi:hypothetical protein
MSVAPPKSVRKRHRIGRPMVRDPFFLSVNPSEKSSSCDAHHSELVSEAA